MRRNRQSTGGSHCNTPPGTKSGGENGGLGGAEHLRTPLLVVYSAVPAATTCTLNPLSARRIAHVKPCTPLPTTTAVMSSSFFSIFLGGIPSREEDTCHAEHGSDHTVHAAKYSTTLG